MDVELWSVATFLQLCRFAMLRLTMTETPRSWKAWNEQLVSTISTRMKNISPTGNLPQIGVKIQIFETTT